MGMDKKRDWAKPAWLHRARLAEYRNDRSLILHEQPLTVCHGRLVRPFCASVALARGAGPAP